VQATNAVSFSIVACLALIPELGFSNRPIQSEHRGRRKRRGRLVSSTVSTPVPIEFFAAHGITAIWGGFPNAKGKGKRKKKP